MEHNEDIIIDLNGDDPDLYPSPESLLFVIELIYYEEWSYVGSDAIRAAFHVAVTRARQCRRRRSDPSSCFVEYDPEFARSVLNLRLACRSFYLSPILAGHFLVSLMTLGCTYRGILKAWSVRRYHPNRNLFELAMVARNMNGVIFALQAFKLGLPDYVLGLGLAAGFLNEFVNGVSVVYDSFCQFDFDISTAEDGDDLWLVASYRRNCQLLYIARGLGNSLKMTVLKRYFQDPQLEILKELHDAESFYTGEEGSDYDPFAKYPAIDFDFD